MLQHPAWQGLLCHCHFSEAWAAEFMVQCAAACSCTSSRVHDSQQDILLLKPAERTAFGMTSTTACCIKQQVGVCCMGCQCPSDDGNLLSGKGAMLSPTGSRA